MSRPLLAAAFLIVSLSSAHALTAPEGQIHIDANQILRGHFTEQRQMQGMAPMQTAGHFVLSPGNGLIWCIEKPLPTTTIITPNGITQDLGGLAMKLPAKKNLRRIYDTVGGALQGNWSGLEEDFNLASSSKNGHWQIVLTPKPGADTKMSYSSITVSGSKFVENIIMVKGDGMTDSFTFSDPALAETPLTAKEIAVFNEGAQQ